MSEPELWDAYVLANGRIEIDRGIPPYAHTDLRRISEEKSETFDFYRQHGAEVRGGHLFVPGTRDAPPAAFEAAVKKFVRRIDKVLAASELSRRYKNVVHLPEMRPGETFAEYTARRARLAKLAQRQRDSDRER